MSILEFITALEEIFKAWFKKPIPPVVPPHISKITPWALAIQHQEGGKIQDRNTRNHNAGNLKFTPYTKSLGALKADSGNFCIFATYDAGFKALTQFLRDACTDKLASYRSTMTLDHFTTIYAVPPNKNYVKGVAKDLGVEITVQIKDLL